MDDWVAKNRLSLLAPERLKALSVRSDWRGTFHLLSQVGALIVTTVLLAKTWGSWWMIPPFMAQGILLNALYAGQHEMCHRTAFKSRLANAIIGEIIGFIVILPAQWDRLFHFAHHRNTQDPAKDPELLAYGIFDMKGWYIAMSGLPFGWGQAKAMVSAARGSLPDYTYWLSEKEKPPMVAEARWHLALYALIAILSVVFHSWIALKFWLGPMLLMKWFHQFQNVGEHTAMTHEPDTLSNTRTLVGPALMRWLMWNMSYHAAHHTFPSIPFHRLPELDRELRAKGAKPMVTLGYLRIQGEIVKTLSQRAAPITGTAA